MNVVGVPEPVEVTLDALDFSTIVRLARASTVLIPRGRQVAGLVRAWPFAAPNRYRRLGFCGRWHVASAAPPASPIITDCGVPWPWTSIAVVEEWTAMPRPHRPHYRTSYDWARRVQQDVEAKKAKRLSLLWIPIFGAVIAIGLWIKSIPTGCGPYTNSNLTQVARPCGNWLSFTAPPGATARCLDGSWSSSRHPYASWTCSGHWGVAYHL
jgi:Protein of unknown function (DUF3761)